MLHGAVDEEIEAAARVGEEGSAEGEAVNFASDAEADHLFEGGGGVEWDASDGPTEGALVLFEDGLELLWFGGQANLRWGLS